MKKRWGLYLFFWVLWMIPSVSHAQQLLYDDFTTTSQVDTSTTTAFWDQPNSLYRLNNVNTPQAIALAEYGFEYALINGNNVSFYQYNGGSMQNVPAWSIPVTNPLGIAMRKDERALWVFTGTDIKRYDFTGSGMAYNPNLSVLGLSGIVGVATQPYQDQITAITNTGQISVYMIDSSSGSFVKNNLLSFNSGIANPLSISMVSGSADLVVTDSNGSHYFSFNGTSYSQNANLSKLGLTKVMGADQPNSSLTAIVNDQIQRYIYDGTTMQSAPLLGSSNSDHPIALSTRTDNYDYAYLTDDGRVQYYTFDGTQMKLASSLSVTGLSLARAYVSPQRYQSNLVTASKVCNLVRVTSTENNDPGSSIVYSVSSDGGSSWTTVPAGSWFQVPDGTQFKLRADLQSTVPTSTPRLLDVKLEATKIKLSNLTVTSILFPPPGQPVPTSTFPFQTRAGAEFTFQIDTDGYVDNLTATLTNGDTVTLTPKNPIAGEQNTFWARYTPSTVLGTGTSVGITFNANFQSFTGAYTQNPFFITNGTVSQAVGIKLVQ